ncbi:MAG: (2Fe-2S)-binding protein, partial [Planctomycetes bacterium]|nr:(2Fe-2S)-binding protein [Planctomycetota bacterium]
MINLTINGQSVTVEENLSILHAAEKLGICIPTLCHMEWDCFGLEHVTGSCRICVVEIEGRPNLAPSCCTPATEGMVVRTNTIRAINARRTILDLLLSNHPKDCLICEKNQSCTLQKLAAEFGLHRILYDGERAKHPVDIENRSIVRDPNKCIMCRRCETACNRIQTVGILSATRRGFQSVVMPTAERKLADTKCTFCGQCVTVCPVGALTEMNYVFDVWKALNDAGKTVIVQIAPAVRVAIGEAFDMKPGSISTGKLVTALRSMGFNRVFDTNFAADLTIMEEAHEFLERLKSGDLPILTSCCPGWVNFLEYQFPDLVKIPSTAKSPQQMFGAIAKSYFAKKIGVDPKNMVVVSVMPCLSKKYEAARPEFSKDGI